MISLEPFPYSLRGLDRALRRSAQSLDLDLQLGPFELVGPLRTCTADAVDFVESNGGKIEDTGWMGLAVSGDRPIAAVDIFAGDRTFLGFTGPKYAIHGANATKPLFAAMQLAQLEAERSPKPHVVRIFTIPTLFVSALWVNDGEVSWIPFDETSTEAALPSTTSTETFVKLVRQQLLRRTEDFRRDDDLIRPGRDDDGDDDDDDSNAPGPHLRNWRPS